MMGSRFLSVILLVLVNSPGVQGMLARGPQIVAFAIDTNNADIVYLQIDHPWQGLLIDGISTNAGVTFQLSKLPFPAHIGTTNASVENRRFVLVEDFLLRSDDNGETWTNTAARRFLREQTQAAIQIEHQEFNKRYGSRLPNRSKFWNPVYIMFAGIYMTCVVFGKGRAIHKVQTVLRGFGILLVIWLALTVCVNFFHWMANSQWSPRLWNTSASFNPSAKTGLILAIAARPGPLILYLSGTFFILPGAVEALLRFSKWTPEANERAQSAVMAIAASAFLLFHGALTFWGYLAE